MIQFNLSLDPETAREWSPREAFMNGANGN